MAKTTLVLMSVCALAVGACGPATMNGAGAGDASEVIFVDTGEGIAAFDTASGNARWDAPGTLASPGFDTFFSVDSSLLVTLDPETGLRRNEMDVPAGLTATVASFDGEAVALTEDAGSTTPYEPARRSSTTIVVARPDQGRHRAYHLDGNFEPEAFSTDERELFLIEYLDAGDPPRYRVRVLRLKTGTLAPVGRLTKVAPDSMRGTGRVQAYSPGGDVLYTLYTKQPPNYAHQHPGDVHDKGTVHAFIHVLNLKEGWAHCVDLPMPFGMGEEPANMLAVSPDGSRVYAGDGESIATVSAGRLRVTAVRDTKLSEPTARAVVAPDGRLFVGSGSEVRALDGETLEPLGSFPLSGDVRSLGIAPLGDDLFVGTDRGISIIDLDSGKELSSIEVLAPTEIVYGGATRP
jgi:hypothetical protein